MTVLTVLVHLVCGLTALLALYYTLKQLSADLVLLGAAGLCLIVWGIESAVLAIKDVAGGAVPDPITLYGYLLTGLALPLAGAWFGVFERSRWGSLAIGVATATMMVLQMRLAQIWPGGFESALAALGAGGMA